MVLPKLTILKCKIQRNALYILIEIQQKTTFRLLLGYALFLKKLFITCIPISHEKRDRYLL